MHLPASLFVSLQGKVCTPCQKQKASEDRKYANANAKAAYVKKPHDAAKRAAQNMLTDRLSDGYVSKRLKKNMPALRGVKLPQSLIEVERMRLMIVREVKAKESK